MTLRLIPAALAILFGLIAAGAVDYLTDSGGAGAIAWTVFALSLVVVARDTLFGGSYVPALGEAKERLSRIIVVRGGNVRVRFWELEPVATTIAIITGLGANSAIAFQTAEGGGTAWAWACFGMSLFQFLGGRLGPSPRRRTRLLQWRWRSHRGESDDFVHADGEGLDEDVRRQMESFFEELRRPFDR